MRKSQALKLWPGDIRDRDPEAPRLMMWCSNKGKDRDPEQRALSVTPKLAQMLRARAMARGPRRPLFDRIWSMSLRFRVVLEEAGQAAFQLKNRVIPGHPGVGDDDIRPRVAAHPV